MTSVPKARAQRRIQYAALPYRQRQDGEVQVRLITSRETRRWVIPKGWPMKGLSPAKAAAREAYEEAGLLGSIASEPIGVYSYNKRLTLQSVPCDVIVFPMKVKRYMKNWPERSERFGFWFSIESAAAAVQEEELRQIILAFGAMMAERFAKKRSRAPMPAMDQTSPPLVPEDETAEVAADLVKPKAGKPKAAKAKPAKAKAAKAKPAKAKPAKAAAPKAAAKSAVSKAAGAKAAVPEGDMAAAAKPEKAKAAKPKVKAAKAKAKAKAVMPELDASPVQDVSAGSVKPRARKAKASVQAAVPENAETAPKAKATHAKAGKAKAKGAAKPKTPPAKPKNSGSKSAGTKHSGAKKSGAVEAPGDVPPGWVSDLGLSPTRH